VDRTTNAERLAQTAEKLETQAAEGRAAAEAEMENLTARLNLLKEDVKGLEEEVGAKIDKVTADGEQARSTIESTAAEERGKLGESIAEIKEQMEAEKAAAQESAISEQKSATAVIAKAWLRQQQLVAWARVHHRAMNDASSQRKLIEEKVTEVVEPLAAKTQEVAEMAEAAKSGVEEHATRWEALEEWRTEQENTVKEVEGKCAGAIVAGCGAVLNRLEAERVVRGASDFAADTKVNAFLGYAKPKLEDIDDRLEKEEADTRARAKETDARMERLEVVQGLRDASTGDLI
jgi:hypothetical protein